MKEVVILVGRQGAGKTWYCQTALPEYKRISQDEGPRRFGSLFRHYCDLLESGVEKIVIDRTNPLRWQRKRFADLAKSHGYRVKIIYFDVPRSLCERRILERKDHPTLKPEKMADAIDHFESVFEMPQADECDELVIIKQDLPEDLQKEEDSQE